MKNKVLFFLKLAEVKKECKDLARQKNNFKKIMKEALAHQANI